LQVKGRLLTPSERTPHSDQNISDLADARAREAALHEILQVISRSRDDETPVFEAILDRAARLCDAQAAGLQLLSDSGSHLRLACNWGDSRGEFVPGWEMEMDSVNALPVAIREARVISFDDLKDSDLYRQGYEPRRLMVDKEGVRSWLIVPLLRDGVGFGSMTLSRHTVKPFTADEITLVEAFAAQAVIAVENVRQFRELQTRLDREAATREILETISRSRDDELPVFEMIVRNAARLCDATLAGIWLVDKTQDRAHYASIWGEDQKVFRIGYEIDLDGPLQVAKTIREALVIHTHDISNDPLYTTRDPTRVKIVEEAGVRTFLTVPLVSDGVALGCLNLNRFEVRPFADADIALVETFAEQAVIAIENVRQFRELQTRLEREAATREILQVISLSRSDTAPVFDVILRNAARLCGAPMAGMAICNEARTHLVMEAHWGDTLTHLAVDQTRWPLDGPTVLATSVNEQRVVQEKDIKETDAYRNGDPGRVEAVDKEGIHTFLAVPLLADGRAIGSIGLYRREVRPFDDDLIELVETFAAQAVIALENVRQFRALEDRTAEVEALNAGLEQRVETQVDELERLGRLRRFLSPQVADAVVSSGSDSLLGSHRAMIAILFCDIRGFTAFCESAEPEEAIDVLQTYHETLGKLIHQAGAGFDHRAGDGIMVIFNDPIPCDDPAGDALRMAVEMRSCMVDLCAGWRKLGHRLGFGVGVSLGYATVGMVGFEGRYDYTASGTAVNLASRLCDQAEDGEILLSPRAAAATEDIAYLEPAGDLELKGFSAPVGVSRVTGMKEIA